MKYKVVTPLARIGQGFAVGDLIEIVDKAEAARMIAANIVAPIKGEREIRMETADLEPVGVETTGRKPAGVDKSKTAKTGRKKR
jgi:hypothetical protein